MPHLMGTCLRSMSNYVWWPHNKNQFYICFSFFSIFEKSFFTIWAFDKKNKQTMIQIKIDQPFLMKYINLGYIVRKTTTGYSNTNLYNVLLSSTRCSTFNTYWSQRCTRHTGWKQSGLRSTKGDSQYNIKQSPLTSTGLNLHWMEFSVSI